MKMEEQQSYYKVGLSPDPKEWVFSNSSLSTINPQQGGHPKKMLVFFSEDKEEEQSKSLETGKLFHQYMEHRDTFAISEIPKPADKLGMAADNIIKDLITSTENTEITDDIILANVRAADWNRKWSDEAVLKNTRDQIKPYVEEYLNNKDKIIVTQQIGDILKKTSTSIFNNEFIETLVFSKGESKEVFTELEVYWENRGLKKKAKLDRLVLDREAKTIQYFDFKTTSKPISLFENSFETYRYYRQFAFYFEAIGEWMKQKELNMQINLYSYAVVVETIEPFCSTIFPITSFWFEEGTNEILELEELIKYHITFNDFTKTKEELINYGKSKFRNKRNYESWFNPNNS